MMMFTAPLDRLFHVPGILSENGLTAAFSPLVDGIDVLFMLAFGGKIRLFKSLYI